MLPPANILLVDDRPENLLVLKTILEPLEQNLVTAASGMAALRRLLEQDFAVILLDVQMNDMDGFETAAMIKQREKTQHTPIIFITAYSQTDAQVFKGYSVGAVDYLFKPILPEILRAKVAAFVDLYQKNEQIIQQTKHIEAMNYQLEQQIQRVNQLNYELEALNKELESFSYSVSHDLRAPLRSISGFSAALIEDYHDKLDSEGQEYLEWIQASCQEMAALIDALLTLARTARRKLESHRVNLSHQAFDIAKTLHKREPERKVKFTIQPDLFAQGDEHLLMVVLENLLSNAWKFTSQREQGEIEFGFRDGAYFVQDNGVGFNMSYKNQLFKPFHRLHDADDFEGHGIGLATVQRIVHRHGGRIWAEGRENEGATFYFTLS